LKLPLGYRYAAAYAGIRKVKQDDVGLIYSEKPAQAAAVFTQNLVQAAPVRLARKNLADSKGRVSAVLVNAGNANCATRTGDDVALASCKAAAKALKTKREFIFPASTGVIGVELDTQLLTNAIPELVSRLSPDGFEAVAKAIMTTDTRMKVAAEELSFSGKPVLVAGMTKGSGMIHPNMATTLGFIMTDAALTARQLREMLLPAIKNSYNSLTVDGDTSTNDTVVLLANGASGVQPGSSERAALQEAINNVTESLAEQIAADGEGARKLIVIRASGFRTEEDARKIARAVASSPLVKTAMAGNDPNWGRILSAAGYSGAMFDPANVDIFLQDVLVCRQGLAADYDEDDLKKSLDSAEVQIRLRYAGRGKTEARYFTCDLTEGYIQINGSYRT
jgi:glutamate N-acetyltransferase/amino-acid N-acetyltransferase